MGRKFTGNLNIKFLINGDKLANPVMTLIGRTWIFHILKTEIWYSPKHNSKSRADNANNVNESIQSQ